MTLVHEYADLSILMIDASPIKTHRIAANGVKNDGQCRSIGRTKGGLNTKLHLVCDGGGLPVHLHLTKGDRADITQAKQCLGSYVTEGTTVIADRFSDANHLREWLSEIKATPCIPPRKNRKIQFQYDTNLCKTRNIVERMFNRLKDWRQLFLRTFCRSSDVI